MDIKATITSTVEKITKDKTLMEQFKSNPVKAVESVIGVDLPDDVIKQVVEGVKAKINVNQATGLLAKIKGLFKK